MKKISAVLLCLCTVFLFAFFAGCEGTQADTFNPDGKAIYTVRIVGGSGSGDYFEGDNCMAEADVPEGKQFMYWQRGEEKVSAAESYLFAVTEDVILRAVYADAVADIDREVCEVSVPKLSFLNGLVEDEAIASGTGTYLEGATCSLRLDARYASKASFKGWAVLGENGEVSAELLSTDVTCTFEVTENIQVVPVFGQGFVKLARPGKETARFKDPYLEFNRDTGDKFVDFGSAELAYLRVNLYTDPEGAGSPAGWFKLLVNPENPTELYVAYADGTKAFDCVGNYSNCYRNTVTASDHADFFRAVLGDGYVAGRAYYFTSQAVAKEGTVRTVDGMECEVGDSLESEVNETYYYVAS